jgi:thiol-disulfide isomerase/thioredoxin
MRGLRYSLTVLTLLGLMPSPAKAQNSGVTPSALLKLRPTIQGIEYDTPTDQAAINACKYEKVVDAHNKPIGHALRDGQGKLLRRFVAVRADHLDQWSYYQDGFEVYREDDLNGDRSLDECRWLNAGGMRIAKIERGKIKAWKQISAEEASKVLVQAFVSGDLALLDTVMATPEELAAAGASKEIVAQVAQIASKRQEQVAELRKKLIGWTEQTVWNRFDGTFPHVIPADPASGLEKDLVLYENAMVIPGTTAAQQNLSKMAFLQIPDMIQLGTTWKFVELPRAIDPEKPIIAAASGIRAMLFDRANNIEPRDEAVDTALKTLADYDIKNAPLLQTGENEKIARYNVGRVPLLRGIVKASKNPDDQLNYNKQVVDSVVGAFRTGLYPQGKKTLEALIADGGKLGSYAAYSLIDAEFAIENNAAGANILANQKKWMADLDGFLKNFPNTDEVPLVLLHLANANEFSMEEKKAREQYGKLVEAYAATDSGRKAAGALRRLDLVGKSLGVKGTGLQNEMIDTSQFHGKPVLIVFWASWAGQVKNDLPDLTKIYDKYHGRGLQVVGINLDNERAELDTFLKQNKLAWPQIFEGGAMDSRLAIDYGIISLPTMVLVDGDGKAVGVYGRSSDVEKQLEKLMPNKEAGIADRRQ